MEYFTFEKKKRVLSKKTIFKNSNHLFFLTNIFFLTKRKSDLQNINFYLCKAEIFGYNSQTFGFDARPGFG